MQIKVCQVGTNQLIGSHLNVFARIAANYNH